MKLIINGLSKIMLTALITLIVLIAIKANSSFKAKFYKIVYESSFSFAKLNNLYINNFGKIIPTANISPTKPVFNETLNYEKKESYLDGVSLTVSNNYLVPALESGVVVYIGEKEGYGNVVIVNSSDNTDIWYGNMQSIDLNLYQYIDKGEYIGSASDKIYMVFKNNGKVLNYDKFI